MDGVINVVKPKDWTSFDVIAKLRRIYHQKKIGHEEIPGFFLADFLCMIQGKAHFSSSL
jgi:tRNA pseudouridine55 synthase